MTAVPGTMAGATWHAVVPGCDLRPIHDGDLPWLRDLYASSRTDELAVLPWPDIAKRAFLDSQFTAQHLSYRARFPEAAFLALEREGRPLGRYYLDRGASDLIVDICLFPEARGQGLGTALIRAGQHDAATRGRDMTLHVQHTNPAALRLYRRLGFVVTDGGDTHATMRWSHRAHAPPAAVS